MSSKDANLSYYPSLSEKLFRNSLDFVEDAKVATGKKLVMAFNKAICQSMIAHDDYDPQHYSFRYETKVEGTTWKGECWVEYLGGKDDE